MLESFEASRERDETTAQEAARRHFESFRQQNHPEEEKYTWKRWQACDLRYAFFLAAASAPDDLRFHERHRKQMPTYYEKMKSFVDPVVIFTQHLGEKQYYDKMAVRLSRETFDLIRWDSSRMKYLVDQKLLNHIREMVNGPLPEREESTFDTSPDLLFQPRFNAPPRRPSGIPEWDNYLNKELAQKFWEYTIGLIDDLAKANEVVFFKADQYEPYR